MESAYSGRLAWLTLGHRLHQSGQPLVGVDTSSGLNGLIQVTIGIPYEDGADAFYQYIDEKLSGLPYACCHHVDVVNSFANHNLHGLIDM